MAQQCFIFAEPVALELQGIATRVFPSRDSGYDPYNVVIAASRSYAEKHPDTVRRLQRALDRGWRRYLDDPASTNAHMAELNPAMSGEAMDLAATKLAPFIENADTARLGLGAMTAERWTAIAEELKSLGRIDRVPTPEEIFVWGER
jgi:NitT/TauT family transport system substrate-binding protein